MPAEAAPASDSDYAERFIEQALPFVDQLYRAACRLTASRYDAEDLLQETMLSGFKGFRRYRLYFADVEGYRYREIAKLMNVPVGTVMSRLARGRRQLRELLADVFAQRPRVSTVTGG
jgi:DNA-directed RNA polymerase specialized sigma24 family protein